MLSETTWWPSEASEQSECTLTFLIWIYLLPMLQNGMCLAGPGCWEARRGRAPVSGAPALNMLQDPMRSREARDSWGKCMNVEAHGLLW